MLQTIAGKTVYVVDFDTMPELPITGLTEEEQAHKDYEKLVGGLFGNLTGTLLDSANHPRQGRYAEALTNAIETGVITLPGKYGIYLVPDSARYEVYKIIEEK